MPSTSLRNEILCNAKRVVVKVGTNVVCNPAGGVNRDAIANLAAQISELHEKDISVTLVASGAIGSGLPELGLDKRPKNMPMLQACAAVGQGQLMRELHDIFAAYKLPVGQVLLTRDDFDKRSRYLN